MRLNQTQQLLSDAKARGLSFDERPGMTIVRLGQRDGIIVWPDFAITRYSPVSLTSTRITIAQARHVLRLA